MNNRAHPFELAMSWFMCGVLCAIYILVKLGAHSSNDLLLIEENVYISSLDTGNRK